MKLYVDKMPRSCAECDRFCLDENGRFRCILNSMPDYRSQEEKETARRNDCPLNSIQTLLAEKEKEQNQIAIGQLEKARETINDKYQYLSKLEQQGDLTFYG